MDSAKIQVCDSWLYAEGFAAALKESNETQYNQTDLGGAIALLAQPSPELLRTLQCAIAIEEGQQLYSFSSYMRLNPENFDTKRRIHEDSKVDDARMTRAAILYLTDNDGCSGTAFWSPNPEERKEPLHFVAARVNRLLMFPAHYHHSRYPFAGFGRVEAGSRSIIAMFYKLKGD